jgi:hypothetical protein
VTPLATSGGTAYSRADFQRFFRRKYLVLLKAAFDRAQRRVDFRDPRIIERVAAGFAGLAAPPSGTSPVPRRIFMLWQQGWNAAPPLVHACADSWRRHNPDWELHLLDNETLADFAPSWKDFRLPTSGRPALSNIARLALLKEQGGVWADATLFCTRPLRDWLPSSELSIFSYPRPYRYLDIWFIAAAGASPTVTAWHEMVRQYWQHFTRGHHYYWMEYLFEMLCETDPAAAAAWSAMPKLSALGPLTVHGNPFDQNPPGAIRELIDKNVVPVHKLSHKWRYRGLLTGTPVGRVTGLPQL